MTTNMFLVAAVMDYVAVDEVRVLSQAASRQCVSLEILNDGVEESSESFSVVLASDDPFFIMGPPLLIQILGDDGMLLCCTIR